jgi:hypothetical protein
MDLLRLQPVTLAMVLRRIFLDQARATNQDATEFVLFEAERRASFEGRMVGLSAFVGIVFLLWVPYMLFKRMVCMIYSERCTKD